MDEKNVEVLENEAEELEANESDDALDTEESEADEETDEVEDGEDDDESLSPKDRARNQINRLKAEIKTLKEKVKESNSEEGKVASPLVERTFLAQEGITDKTAQQEVIRLAKKLDLSIEEAVEDADIRQRAESLQKKIQAKQASARPKGKGGATKRDAQWYVDHNILPEDPGMRVQVWDILAKNEL